MVGRILVGQAVVVETVALGRGRTRVPWRAWRAWRPRRTRVPRRAWISGNPWRSGLPWHPRIARRLREHHQFLSAPTES